MTTRAISIECVIIMALALGASAQVTVGDNISMNLNGQASFGYTADYGNTLPSDHGLNFGGAANLTGSYYTPNFLNFNISPYYNQSRANSSSQSISDSSGVTATAFLFSGSHFPGSVSYSKSYNSLGIFGAPGIANYTSHGNGDAINIGWGVNLPDLPSLSASYLQGHDDYSIYGQEANGSSRFHNINLHSNYAVGGFNLNGGYVYTQNHSQYPLLVASEEQTSDNHSNSFSFGANHPLPLHGSFSANFNRSDFHSEFSQSNYAGTVDTVSSNVMVHPVTTLTLAANTSYTDNLVGTLVQNITTAGGVIQQTTPGQSSNAFDVNGLVSYNVTQHVLLTGTVERRQQSFFGNTFGSNGITGSASYWNRIWGGSLSAVVGVTRTSVDSSRQGAVGLLGVLTYSRKVGLWDLAGSGNYYQNTQTILVGYTTSGFGYNANLGRKFGRSLHWNASASGSRSLLNQAAGYGNHSESYSTGFGAKWLGVNANYAKSDGSALFGGTGLVPNPLPNPILLPAELVFYGGHSYGGGVGVNPFKRFTASASYSRAFSDTMNRTMGSHNNTESIVVRLQYQYRQMWFTAGYSKFVQGFSASGIPPANINSYYFGVQRWFNFF